MERFLIISIATTILFVGTASSMPSMDLDELIYQDPNNRVVGGSSVRQPVPYQISMQVKTSNGVWRHFCGGSIIAPNRIITAAHCVVDQDPKRLSVLAGITDLRKADDGQRRDVIEYEVHENYEELVTSDIAIVNIDPPLEMNGNTVGAIDYAGSERVDGGIPVTLTGWGSISPAVYGPYPNNLQILNYTTLTNDDCKERGFSQLTDTEVCAYRSVFRGACAGDSGGPLVSQDRNKLIGIVSYGTFICAIGVPDAFTRVSVFDEWIRDRMEYGNEACEMLEAGYSQYYPRSMDSMDGDAVWHSNSHTNVSNGNRIIGGQVVTGPVSYQISMQLFRRNRWHHFCGGAIISRSHILTAAHCVERYRAEDITIAAGTLTWRTGGVRHKVVALRQHPGYDKNSLIMTNDIAIVKVSPSFLFNRRTVGPICLDIGSRIDDRIPVKLTGWGSMNPGPAHSALSEQLQSLDYSTISNGQCREKGFRVTSNEVCAFYGSMRGACVGDSGGPLVTTQNQRYVALVGIVSYGTATCAAGKPDVYTRVSSFIPWIQRVTKTEMP